MLGTLSKPRRGQMSHIRDISALRVNNMKEHVGIFKTKKHTYWVVSPQQN